MSDVFDSSKAQSATVALFVSDIHLDVSRARTSAAFLQFLQQVLQSVDGLLQDGPVLR